MSRSCLLLLCILGLLLNGCGATAPPEEAPVAADAFLNQIRSGNVDEAWEATTSEFKSFMGRDRLRSFVRSTPLLQEPAVLQKCEPVELESGLKLFECVYAPESGSKTVRVLLDAESGQWKVERLYVD